jgi:hypothetical protein
MKQNTFKQPIQPISLCLVVGNEWTPAFNASTSIINYDRVEGLS